MKNDFSKLMLIGILSLALTLTFNLKTKSYPEPKVAPVPEKIAPEAKPQTPPEPSSPQISNPIPQHLSYPQTVEQLKTWNKEAPDLTEVGIYGQSKKGTDLFYIRVNNKLDKNTKPVILITACIHGNESWSAGVTMGYLGNLIKNYSTDPKIKTLINSRDIYFIPVVSPDSYTQQRFVDGVDPNRDFPTPKNKTHQSTPSVAALREFYWKIKPHAVLSGHTYGRFFLIPYGDQYGKNPNQSDYDAIVGKMAKMANYKMIHCAELYKSPIDGTEVDWFYRNGSFATVIEYGTHQHKPSLQEIKDELKRTQDAITYFIEKSPDIKITTADNGIDFSQNTGIAKEYHRNSDGTLKSIDPH
jgi:hypothetical protein